MSEKLRWAQDTAAQAVQVAEMVQKSSLGHEVFERQALLEGRVSALDTSVGSATDETQQLSRRVDVLAAHFRFSRKWEEEFSGKFLELDLQMRESRAHVVEMKSPSKSDGEGLKWLDVHKRLAEHLVRLENLVREQAVQGMETASAVTNLYARLEHLEGACSSKSASGATSPIEGVGSAVLAYSWPRSDNSDYFRPVSRTSQISGPMLCDLLSNLELQVVDATSRVDSVAAEINEGDRSSCDRLHLQLERYSARLVAIRHEVSMGGTEAAEMDPALRRVESSLHSLRRRFESLAGRAPTSSFASVAACCSGRTADGCGLGVSCRWDARRPSVASVEVLLSPRPSVETESDGDSESPRRMEGAEQDVNAPAQPNAALTPFGTGPAKEAVEALERQVRGLRAQLGGLELQLLDLRSRFTGTLPPDNLSASLQWLADPGLASLEFASVGCQVLPRDDQSQPDEAPRSASGATP